MARSCRNCGSTFDDQMNVCPRCGVPYVEQAQYQQPTDYQQPVSYQQPTGYQQPMAYQQPAPYQQPMYQQAPVQEQPMTPGNWALTIFLTSGLGIISLILLFVWGFGSGVPIAKKNYCLGMLIFMAIMIGITVVLWIILAIVGVSLLGSLSDLLK